MTDSLKAFRAKFGRQLHNEKVAKGLTNRQLATALDVVPSAISCWENGKHLPKTENRRRVCEMFPSLSVFFAGDVMKPKEEKVPDAKPAEIPTIPPVPIRSTRYVWHTSEGFCWMVESAAAAWQRWMNLKKELTYENDNPSSSSLALADKAISHFLREEERKADPATKEEPDKEITTVSVPMYRTADGTEWKSLTSASLWAAWLALRRTIDLEGTRAGKVEEVHALLAKLTYEAERREYKAPGEGVSWKRV